MQQQFAIVCKKEGWKVLEENRRTLVRRSLFVGYGFSGIVVALFGGLHPAGILPAAFFFGILLYAQVNLQILTSVPPNLVEALQGLIILIIVAVQMIISNPYLEEKFRKKFFQKKEA